MCCGMGGILKMTDADVSTTAAIGRRCVETSRTAVISSPDAAAVRCNWPSRKQPLPFSVRAGAIAPLARY